MATDDCDLLDVLKAAPEFLEKRVATAILLGTIGDNCFS
jgi:hypothetical protein